MISIPSLHVSTKSKADGAATIFISSRQDATHSGEFDVRISVNFDLPIAEFPAGSLTLRTNLTDSVKANFTATTFDLINSFGKHNPAVYITGRCRVDLLEHVELPKGCRYWIMIANNKTPNAPTNATPDIVGFAIHDRFGNRVAYGTGPVRNGDLTVVPFGD